MKVLFMTNIPSPYRVDFFYELGKSCDLTVTFEGKTATDRDKKWKADKFQNFKAEFMKGIRTGSDSFLCLEIIKIIKRGFDRIILVGYSTPTAMFAIEYMRIHRIPFFIEVDGGLISQDSALKYKIKKRFISSAAGWFSTGKTVTDYLVHYGAKRDKCYQYVFTSQTENDLQDAAKDEISRKEYCEKLGIAEDKVVVTVGQFIPRKGFDILIKAAKKMVEDIGIYIIGGEATEEYKEMATGMKNIHFVGFKTKKELADYYKAADLFVLPTREDIWGLVINEAMAFGLPIITTDKCVAGLELVDGNGYIVPVGDDEALREKMMEILSNPKLAEKIGKRSREIIKDYTIEKMAEEHMKVFNSNFAHVENSNFAHPKDNIFQ